MLFRTAWWSVLATICLCLPNRACQRSLLLALLCCLAAPQAAAQAPDSPPDPFRFVVWAGGDVKAIGRGMLSLRPLYAAAGMGGVLLLLSGQDPALTRGAIDLAESAGSRPRKILNEIGNVKSVRPLALIFFLGTLTSRNKRLQDAAFTSLEAIVFSNLLTNALKTLTGRARPWQNEGATTFKPFSGNTSFPSGHATTVFAFTTPWLLYYGNAPSIGLFILGIGTSFTRIADNVHWFTDVLVGAGIGFSTAYLLTQRHKRQSSRLTVAPVVSGGQAGVFVRLKL